MLWTRRKPGSAGPAILRSLEAPSRNTDPYVGSLNQKTTKNDFKWIGVFSSEGLSTSDGKVTDRRERLALRSVAFRRQPVCVTELF